MKITNSDVYIAGGYISMKQMYEEFVKDCGASYLEDGGFEFSDKVLNGVKVIGDFLELPQGGVYVSSSYRPGRCNSKIGGASKSQHKTGNAIDIVFKGTGISNKDSLNQIWDNLLCKGQLFQDLEAVGIKGIGSYKTFIHIDDGGNPENIRSSMTGWDNGRGNGWSTSYIKNTENFNCGGTPRDTTGLEDYISSVNDPEDGVKTNKAKAFEIAFISLGLMIIGVLLFFVIRKRRRNKS